MPSDRRQEANRIAAQRQATAIILFILTVLFCLRVSAQLVQSRWGLDALPGFDSWQSGAMPYGYLLLAQCLVIGLMLFAIRQVLRGRSYGGLGILLCALGSLYLAAMILRAVVGFLQLSDIPWFDHPLPTAFHFVLSGFVLLLGWHWAAPAWQQESWHRWPSRIAPGLAYPTVVLAALGLFSWLTREGVHQAFAAYLSVTLGATAILAHELLNPYRSTWRPVARTVGWDVVYLLLVQVMLPVILPLLLLGGIFYVTEFFQLDPVAFWPHDWPVIAQAAAMICIADFLRYWLHRASHKVRWLWALHAVHHAPKELYFLNVGRFHPGDKAIQYLFDALPFVLMGVGPDVLTAYFVFYAINGFFQHSNANVRLGPLNWIVSGPELHRWHHAKNYKQANHNYGNNLIVWDLLFGTRYLPADDDVGELGIGNASYPDDFLGQTLAPFVSSPDSDRKG